jgi:hypothetical protein
MEEWSPTPVEVMSATTFVLSEEPVLSDALYIFGSMADRGLDERELKTASVLYHLGVVSKNVVHGATVAEVSSLFDLEGYGYEFLKEVLMQSGVPEADIVAIPRSSHTAGEARNFLLMAAERGWNTVTIMAYPFHQLRCFLQMITLMEETGVWLKVYNKSFVLRGVDWQRPIKRAVRRGENLLGMKDMNELMRSHVAADYDRIVKYAQDPTLTGQNFTRHATIPEMFRYVARRDTILKS